MSNQKRIFSLIILFTLLFSSFIKLGEVEARLDDEKTWESFKQVLVSALTYILNNQTKQGVFGFSDNNIPVVSTSGGDPDIDPNFVFQSNALTHQRFYSNFKNILAHMEAAIEALINYIDTYYFIDEDLSEQTRDAAVTVGKYLFSLIEEQKTEKWSLMGGTVNFTEGIILKNGSWREEGLNVVDGTRDTFPPYDPLCTWEEVFILQQNRWLDILDILQKVENLLINPTKGGGGREYQEWKWKLNTLYIMAFKNLMGYIEYAGQGNVSKVARDRAELIPQKKGYGKVYRLVSLLNIMIEREVWRDKRDYVDIREEDRTNDTLRNRIEHTFKDFGLAAMEEAWTFAGEKIAGNDLLGGFIAFIGNIMYFYMRPRNNSYPLSTEDYNMKKQEFLKTNTTNMLTKARPSANKRSGPLGAIYFHGVSRSASYWDTIYALYGVYSMFMFIGGTSAIDYLTTAVQLGNWLLFNGTSLDDSWSSSCLQTMEGVENMTRTNGKDYQYPYWPIEDVIGFIGHDMFHFVDEYDDYDDILEADLKIWQEAAVLAIKQFEYLQNQEEGYFISEYGDYGSEPSEGGRIPPRASILEATCESVIAIMNAADFLELLPTIGQTSIWWTVGLAIIFVAICIVIVWVYREKTRPIGE